MRGGLLVTNTSHVLQMAILDCNLPWASLQVQHAVIIIPAGGMMPRMEGSADIQTQHKEVQMLDMRCEGLSGLQVSVAISAYIQLKPHLKHLTWLVVSALYEKLWS